MWFIVDHDPAVAGDNRVDVLVAVFDVVVSNGFCADGELYLVDLECRDSESFADPLVVGARGRVRSMACRDRLRVEIT